MIDDEKIIELFFERSEQAIRELDIKYGKICHNLSYNIVNSRQDAEECVNDAYLGAWNAIPPVRPNPLLSYIVKIVRNISLKIYWRKEAAKRSGHYTIALEEIEGCIADQKTVEDEIEARELARIIEAFLDIPNIIIRKTKPLGHYGRLRKAYLEMHRPILFNELVLSDKLFEHCAEIDEAAQNRMELIVPQLAKQYGVTERLKAENQMEWVRQMNACKAQAEEVVKAELIYD